MTPKQVLFEIEEIRELAHVTQLEVFTNTSLTKITVHQLKHCIANPTLGTLCEYLDYLGLEIKIQTKIKMPEVEAPPKQKIW